MAQHLFLKSIRPVNLLSFGPNTEEIELKPLNILIGPNGSGKSNLIEILGLLSKLSDKDPWSKVRETGGAREWIWKGKGAGSKQNLLSATTTAEKVSVFSGRDAEKSLLYSIGLWAGDGAFAVMTERFLEIVDGEDGTLANQNTYDRDERDSVQQPTSTAMLFAEPGPKLPLGRSVLSMIGNVPSLTTSQPRIIEFADNLARFAFYREWTFGAGSKSRSLERAGSETTFLDEDSGNLAHVLNFILTHQNQEPGEKLRKAFQAFSDDAKEIETRFQEGFVQLRVREASGISTPASRLSDGTLRWLALLAILLNPVPPPVSCIDEPELGLHPDILPTLADLLVEASTRTQLIVTTHSSALVDAFSDDPESVCVCEKVDGSTVIRRLARERLEVWLKDYSLGHLWASGEIGGNRW